MKELFSQAEKLIADSRQILLAGHREPDGDSLGSMLGLSLALEKINKKTLIYCPPVVPDFFSFLPKFEKILFKPALDDVDLIIGLDYGQFDRLELGDYYRLAKMPFLTIDHHPKNQHVGLQIITENASSTAEIIYSFLKYLDIEIDPKIATCLLTGIVFDTGGFRHTNTSSQTLEIAGNLLRRGASLQKIIKAERGQPTARQLWHQIFSGLQIDEPTGLAYSFIKYSELIDAKKDFSASKIANLLISLPEAKIILLLTEKSPGLIDGTLRCRPNAKISVSKIAQLFGGGGHHLAAGFRTEEKPNVIVARIKKALIEKSA